MNTDLVYSTEHGKMCPKCNQPVAQCSCKKKKSPSKGDGKVRVSRSTKGRKGKCVTLITGLPLNQIALSTLAKELKQKCGTGGTVKQGDIEIQGDHCDTIVTELKSRGYAAKRSGG